MDSKTWTLDYRLSFFFGGGGRGGEWGMSVTRSIPHAAKNLEPGLDYGLRTSYICIYILGGQRWRWWWGRGLVGGLGGVARPIPCAGWGVGEGGGVGDYSKTHTLCGLNWSVLLVLGLIITKLIQSLLPQPLKKFIKNQKSFLTKKIVSHKSNIIFTPPAFKKFIKSH